MTLPIVLLSNIYFATKNFYSSFNYCKINLCVLPSFISRIVQSIQKKKKKKKNTF